jgi:TM2 domain-containing membrane protein YozV/DNA-directed RNA polymerase subunit RPC12/RpoP
MKQIVCEACGGKDLVIQDGVLICQHCNTKYFLKKKKKKKLSNEETIDSAGSISETHTGSQLEKSFEINTEKNNFSWGFLTFLSIFLGWLGVDRFYVGDISSGLLKLMIFLFFFFSIWFLTVDRWLELKLLASIFFLAGWGADIIAVLNGENGDFARFRKKNEQEKKDNWL